MTEAEFRKHLDAAEKSPKQIAAAVSGLPDKTLRYKPAPDKWCILEILAHLADIEILYAFHCHSLPKNEHETRARFLSRSLEFPKRRTTDRLYRLLGCRGFETRHKEDESQARMGVNGVA